MEIEIVALVLKLEVNLHVKCYTKISMFMKMSNYHVSSGQAKDRDSLF